LTEIELKKLHLQRDVAKHMKKSFLFLQALNDTCRKRNDKGNEYILNYIHCIVKSLSLIRFCKQNPTLIRFCKQNPTF